MRRFFAWYLPLTIAAVAAAVFASGFYSFVSGHTGEAVAPVHAPLARAEAKQAPIALLIMGDSLARGAGDNTGLGIGGRVAEELKRRGRRDQTTVNVAINGLRAPELEKQLESRSVQTIVVQANVIIISIGGNDLWSTAEGLRGTGRKDPEKLMNGTLERVGAIVGKVRSVNPRARIFLIGLYNPFVKAPFGALLTSAVNRWNAMEMARFANDGNLTVVQTSDIFSHHARLAVDNFHPNEEGYSMIARRIVDSL